MCGSSLNWYVPVLYAIRVLQSRHRMEYRRNAVGSLAQVRALTRDGTLDKVNGNLVPRTHCLVLEALLATLRTREKCLFLSCSEPFCLIMQTAMLQ